MSRASIAARKAKAAAPQVPAPSVPSQAGDSESVAAPAITTEPEQSVTETDNVDTAAEGSTDEQNGAGQQPEPEPPSSPSTEEPIAEPQIEIEKAAARISLDDDPNTALVGNIFLHLLSEHGDYDALRLDDDEAIAHHAELHAVSGLDHDVADWRFRPAEALAVSLLATAAQVEQSLAANLEPDLEPDPDAVPVG